MAPRPWTTVGSAGGLLLEWHANRKTGSESLLSATHLGGIPEVVEHCQDSLAMVTLYLDSTLADRTAGGARRFQLVQNGIQVRCNGIEARDDGDGLSLAALLTAYTDGLILGELDFASRAARAGAAVHRHFADVAGDRALQRCSVEQA